MYSKYEYKSFVFVMYTDAVADPGKLVAADKITVCKVLIFIKQGQDHLKVKVIQKIEEACR